MTQPGDHGGFGPLLHREAFRPGDRTAADRGGMVRDGMGEPVSEVGVVLMKRQERQDCPEEVLDVLGLCLHTAAGVGFLLLGVALGGSFGFKIGPNPLNGR